MDRGNERETSTKVIIYWWRRHWCGQNLTTEKNFDLNDFVA